MSNKNFENWAELLAAKTSIQGDCLIWTEGCHSQGYPMTRWDGEMVLVKRKVMEDKLGTTLERGRRVKNTCGNQLCVNVDHYFVAEQGTKEWIAGTSKYSKTDRHIILQMYDDYAHPTTGTKQGALVHIGKTYVGISNTTIISYLKERCVDYRPKNTA